MQRELQDLQFGEDAALVVDADCRPTGGDEQQHEVGEAAHSMTHY